MKSKLINKIIKRAKDRHQPNISKNWVSPGHFYSPIPDLDQVRVKENHIWDKKPEDLKGLCLNEEEQLNLIEQFGTFYEELPFGEQKQAGLRYYFENEFYSYADAIFLYSMIRHLKPKRLIEVGSGFSSCVALDTNDIFFDAQIECTFIEPFPDVLKSILSDQNKKSINLVEKNLQDVDPTVFASLQANDILFIDSTHVAKVGSDANYIFSEVLPILNEGVYIHFHDIFFPFEYPKNWVYEGRDWNEAYIMKAFLQFNEKFKIVIFSSFLYMYHKKVLQRMLPLCLKNSGGNIWLKKC